MSDEQTSLLMTAITALPLTLGGMASAQTTAKPNIVVIMADDVGIWNISAYRRGMMVREPMNAGSST
jgi:hypothetical protein